MGCVCVFVCLCVCVFVCLCVCVLTNLRNEMEHLLEAVVQNGLDPDGLHLYRHFMWLTPTADRPWLTDVRIGGVRFAGYRHFCGAFTMSTRDRSEFRKTVGRK